MAVLSGALNGWRVEDADGGTDVPAGGVGISFMLGMVRYVLTVAPDGAARLVDGNGVKQPDVLARLVDWLRGKGFAIRDPERPSPRVDALSFIRAEDPPGTPSGRPAPMRPLNRRRR